MIPSLGRSAGEEIGYPLQYSSLENSMDYSPWGHKELDMTEQLSLSLGWECLSSEDDITLGDNKMPFGVKAGEIGRDIKLTKCEAM